MRKISPTWFATSATSGGMKCNLHPFVLTIDACFAQIQFHVRFSRCANISTDWTGPWINKRERQRVATMAIDRPWRGLSGFRAALARKSRATTRAEEHTQWVILCVEVRNSQTKWTCDELGMEGQQKWFVLLDRYLFFFSLFLSLSFAPSLVCWSLLAEWARIDQSRGQTYCSRWTVITVVIDASIDFLSGCAALLSLCIYCSLSPSVKRSIN